MAKRLTDTDKYKKTFMRSLPGAYKLFWDYLYHDCNHAGIWHVDFEVAQIYLGADMPINENTALRLFNESEPRIEPLSGGKKWFIRPFIEFQYKTPIQSLNPANKVHASILTVLTKEGVCKPHASPMQGAKDKDKDKEKDKVKDKDKETPEQEKWFEMLWVDFPAKGKIKKKEALKRFCASVVDIDTAKRCATALDNYNESKRVKEGFVQNAPTWFGDWQSWENYKEETEPKTPSWM